MKKYFTIIALLITVMSFSNPSKDGKRGSNAPIIYESSAYSIDCGDNIFKLKIRTSGNGSDITSYELLINDSLVETVNTSDTIQTFSRTITSDDYGQIYTVRVRNEVSYKDIMGTVPTPDFVKEWTDSDPNFSTGEKIDSPEFPITTGKDFVEPNISYHGPYTYFTDDANLLNQYNTANAPIPVNIPYLGTTYNCTILPKSELFSKMNNNTNATFFLDAGTFSYPTSSNLFIGFGIQVIGAKGEQETIIKTEKGVCWYMYRSGGNTLFQNIVFDGNNQDPIDGRHYFHFEKGQLDNTETNNFMMKKVWFRNIGKSGWWKVTKSVLNFIDREFRSVDNHRYFIDVTIESANLKSAGNPININSTDGVYFKNLDIQTSSGGYFSIHITNSMNWPANTWPGHNYGNKKNIFAGTLKIPKDKAIAVKSFDSRDISFPADFNFLSLNPDWNKMSANNPSIAYGIIVLKDREFLSQPDNNFASPYMTKYAYLDVNDGAYIVRGTADRNTQFEVIRKLLAKETNSSIDINNFAKLPGAENNGDINIKCIDHPNNEIGGFDIPNYGIEKEVNIVCLNNINDPLQQEPMSVNYSNETISLNPDNAHKVSIYNIDFSEYYEIGNAIASDGNKVVNSLDSTFRHDRFKKCNSTLPIELKSFMGYYKNNKVYLEWASLVEVNNNYYRIYKSNDAVNWSMLIEKEGAGNSLGLQTYQTIDQHPYKGITYYKLEQTDYDGTVKELAVFAVKIKDSVSSGNIEVFPNPTENYLRVSSHSENIELLQIFNVTGREVTATTNIQSLSSKEKILDLRNLSAGIYILKVNEQYLKIIKL